MKHKIAATAFVLMSFSSGVWAETYHTGLVDFKIEGARPLDGYVWFPTLQGGTAVPAHGNKVWDAVMVDRNGRGAPVGGFVARDVWQCE